jgi:hypothetical protein
VSAYSTTTTRWLDCPVCHQTSVPSIPGPTHGTGYCPSCKARGVLALARVRKVRAVYRRDGRPNDTECLPCCLNGKADCNCRCGGRCHGRGFCACRDTPAYRGPPPAPGSMDDQRPLF